MRRLPVLALIVLFVPAALSGCIGDDDKEVRVPAPSLDDDDQANNTTLVEATLPTWTVGQWWAHHTYFGPDDTAGNHFNVVVVAADASGYRVASQSGAHARHEAERDLFDLGAFGTDLSTTYQGEAWSWYAFPLVENKTWTQSLRVDDTAHDLEFRANYSTEITTASGPKEGFIITGTRADGAVLMTYDYVIEMGWFSNLDIFSPDDPSVTLFKIRNMGYGEGKTGEYVEVELVEVIGTTLTAGPLPAEATFSVPEGATQLTGPIVVRIATGHATLTMTDPAGGATEYTAAAPGGERSATVDQADPAAGEWTLNLLALGQDATAEVRLLAITETVGTL